MDAVRELFGTLTTIQWRDVLDILLVTYLIYRVVLLVRSTSAMRIAKGFMAILESLNVKVRQQMTARSELGRMYSEYSRLERLLGGGKGVYAFCPYIYMNE